MTQAKEIQMMLRTLDKPVILKTSAVTANLIPLSFARGNKTNVSKMVQELDLQLKLGGRLTKFAPHQ